MLLERRDGMLKRIKYGRLLHACLLIAMLLMGVVMHLREARAEYGDIIMNNYSEAADEAPVVFPHWFHRIRYTCKVCHSDLGFKFKAGAGEINMVRTIDGQYCGACHDGTIAWSMESCNLCHTGTKGLATGTGQRALNAKSGAAATRHQPKNAEGK